MAFLFGSGAMAMVAVFGLVWRQNTKINEMCV
jgi:anaerobic C4-dicarboxylate transporter